MQCASRRVTTPVPAPAIRYTTQNPGIAPGTLEILWTDGATSLSLPRPALAGEHQVDNAALAVLTAGLPGTRIERKDGKTAAKYLWLTILGALARGLSNDEIAKEFWVAPQTVKFHLSNIYRKLEVTNRTEASRWAQVNGLLGDGLSIA